MYARCLGPIRMASIDHQTPTQILALLASRAGFLERMSNILGILWELLLTSTDLINFNGLRGLTCQVALQNFVFIFLNLDFSLNFKVVVKCAQT